MFTGLIESQGLVIANTVVAGGNRLIVDAALSDAKTGESIAVNGVCLTLLDVEKPLLAFDLSQETLRCTNLGKLGKGDTVNLERAMGATDRFGGHYVTGHVDTVAVLTAMNEIGDCLEITVSNFALSSSMMYLIAKGSITLDGVSLTINEVNHHAIKLMLIPHTLEKTTFSELKLGHCFNVEFDYLARIVAHQLALYSQHLDFVSSTGQSFWRGGNERVEGVYTQYMTDDERVSNKTKNSSAKSKAGRLDQEVCS